jgi:hypothetical protein
MARRRPIDVPGSAWEKLRVGETIHVAIPITKHDAPIDRFHDSLGIPIISVTFDSRPYASMRGRGKEAWHVVSAGGSTYSLTKRFDKGDYVPIGAQGFRRPKRITTIVYGVTASRLDKTLSNVICVNGKYHTKVTERSWYWILELFAGYAPKDGK